MIYHGYILFGSQYPYLLGYCTFLVGVAQVGPSRALTHPPCILAAGASWRGERSKINPTFEDSHSSEVGVASCST
ncbi:hypothetical protein BU25DRAFT_469568 [Macroventuria anomochaeta]|uniref:Uncharacterized protein n=1 Tax=Macroventuria anomochaeta TaxID=301207 RepID=A0ACB6RZ34_9PLEO|nr:uncharacterized protein BU25DRAFT_469568 [Macroventuria anomochaeta]KAF2627136.1 hypothetical protein BU25DRAFT_469568 [Macroventuria anomochaeta]